MVEVGQSVSKRREAMPAVSAFVDQYRDLLGAEFVNQQMATAQQARREYLTVLEGQGAAAAKHWHRANAYRCTFYANEGGREIGMPSPFGQTTLDHKA